MRTTDTFDSLIASSGRLRILAALASEPQMEFVGLRTRTQMTDGNLATHTRRLESAGFVKVEKVFRDRKPVTCVALTTIGRKALEKHAQELLDILGMAARKPVDQAMVTPIAQAIVAEQIRADERADWVD